jgi:internalin A
MPSRNHEVRTISRGELPQLLAQWQREKRSGLALLPRYFRVDWYVENGWELEEIFTRDNSVSWDDLAPLVECSGLRRLALPRVKLGDAGARAIAENLTNLQSLHLGDNNVGEAGARAIAESLTNLHMLELLFNNVGDAGARSIAGNLTKLHTLNLGLNNVGEAGARSIAENLINLQTLNLCYNNVGEAGVRAIAESLTKLHTLDLRENNIGEGGARDIAEKLTNLQSLDLGNNNVRDAGAKAIAESLTKLHTLDLRENNIGDTGARAIAESLTKLQRLTLSANNIGEIGARAIAENLTNLQLLFLSYNRLTDDAVRRLAEGLPLLHTIDLQGNESLRLPKELLRSTDAAGLRDYFRRSKSEGKRKLNEAKLIVVGNEAVGKTALVNYLIKDEPCRDTDKTPGLHIQERIEVTPWDTHHTTRDTEKLRLNVWDFGGQEVTRETHKLFLTARSLYLVVLEARRENVADAENVLHDWMRAIRNRGGDDVPVIVVINKSERDRELRLDETTLKKTYPIIDFIRTSCRDPKQDPKDGGKGIVELRQTIIDTIRAKIPQASDEFPLSYFEVKERLREIAKAEHSFDVVSFTNICRDVAHPVTSEDEQRRLLQLLGDIGVVILHKERTLLDPNWLTTAIYRVLTHSDVVKEGGQFRVDDLGRLLMGLEDASHKYPKDRWQYIVDQTVQCGLSFEIADQPGTYLMPEQLPPNAIDTGLDRVEDPQVLRFRYDYEDIPKGLIPRFIVKMRR